MRVKIGDTVYDSEKEPIMLVFENDEQRTQVVKHLQNMAPKPGKARKYLQAPKDMDAYELRAFMKLDEENKNNG